MSVSTVFEKLRYVDYRKTIKRSLMAAFVLANAHAVYDTWPIMTRQYKLMAEQEYYNTSFKDDGLKGVGLAVIYPSFKAAGSALMGAFSNLSQYGPSVEKDCYTGRYISCAAGFIHMQATSLGPAFTYGIIGFGAGIKEVVVSEFGAPKPS